MDSTKKVGSAGRFGSRYGVGIRKRLLGVEAGQRARQVCPNCGFLRVRRVNKGIFYCSKCRHEFAGGAYTPQTLAGGLVQKIVSQKAFTSEIAESLSKLGKHPPISSGTRDKGVEPVAKEKK